nr:hypothetical protein [Candidatus Brachybacter algidus]
MDYWIFHFCSLTIVFEYLFHITGQEDVNQTINNPFYSVIQIRTGNIPKEFS